MDGRHPGAQDASGDIHVGLDSSTPCWKDGIEECPRLTEALQRPSVAESQLKLGISRAKHVLSKTEGMPRPETEQKWVSYRR